MLDHGCLCWVIFQLVWWHQIHPSILMYWAHEFCDVRHICQFVLSDPVVSMTRTLIYKRNTRPARKRSKVPVYPFILIPMAIVCTSTCFVSKICIQPLLCDVGSMGGFQLIHHTVKMQNHIYSFFICGSHIVEKYEEHDIVRNRSLTRCAMVILILTLKGFAITFAMSKDSSSNGATPFGNWKCYKVQLHLVTFSKAERLWEYQMDR